MDKKVSQKSEDPKNQMPPPRPKEFSSEEEEFEYYKNLALYWESYAHRLEAKIAKKSL
ncbi:MAG: hypothetical protein IJM48_07480 [Treponema sp.]|nr:hypothetical protein [Treponema sp.]